MNFTPRSSLSGELDGPHAFVLEDEPRVRAFVAKIIADAGFTSHEFSRVSEIEAALTQRKPEVIVLDLSLGESDAIEAMQSLAASRFGGKILLISGHDPTTLADVHKIGERRGLTMLPFLHKPFRVEELRERLANATILPGFAAAPDLEAALQNNWLELWYQPKIDLHSMLVCGAEALVRLRHPDHGVVLPSAFLPPPGDPLYQPLTAFVLRRSLSDWSAFAAEGIMNRLAINVPASILQSPDFVANVRRHLPTQATFPGLIVEITESEAISDPQVAREVAVQLKLYNVHMAIDDFGAGHSSLARLNELPFVELKLDRKFVSGCATDERKHSMCRNVVELAHRSNISAVAEGVETAADLKALISMGCDAAQGFFFARPMERKDFVNALLSRAVSRR